ncbi:MAG TPA: hypothetical protein VEA18_02655 [Candidatus Kapabacteria bacterium]|nr:hypothetical protein [Candidatus Kapabacteria bacterium]
MQEPKKEFTSIPHPEQQPMKRPEMVTASEYREQEMNKEQPLTQEREGFLDESIESLKQTLRISKKKKHHVIPHVRDALVVQVEKIMEEGLEDAYKEMTPVQQQEFKIKGEQTALQIRTLLQKTKVKVKKIFKLLFEWLKLLPGVNTFFLEQEAKIKADRILSLKKIHPPK